MFARLGLAAVLATSVVLAPTVAHSAPNSQASPPSPTELRATTTALLQPVDMPAALGGPGDQSIGYNIPTGGQDPYPICFTPKGQEVMPDLTMTTGYSSAIGKVTQQVIVYPSEAAANAAWSKVANRIGKVCSYAGSVDGTRTVITNGDLDGVTGSWIRRDTKDENRWSEYTATGPAGNAIITLRVDNKKRASTTASERAAIDALYPVLAQRYVDRANPVGTQSTLLSIAEAAMITPEDMPAALPLESPESGGWSSFSADLPGTVPFNPCYPGDSDIIPAGTGSFSANFGGSGDVFLGDGYVYQQVFTYDNDAAADAAWTRVSDGIQECNARAGKLYNKTQSAWVSKAGASAITVDGTPGLFVRYFTTQGNQDAAGRFSSRTYQLMLKDGATISWLTYGQSTMGIKRMNLDEPAVNELAVTLLDRFVNTVVTTS